MADDPPIVNDTEHDRFVLEEEGAVAELVYERDGGRLPLVHTEVAPALGGRGIGGRLVRAAVDHAAAAGLTVAPWCSYARKWLQDHADVAGAVEVDWSPPPS